MSTYILFAWPKNGAKGGCDDVFGVFTCPTQKEAIAASLRLLGSLPLMRELVCVSDNELILVDLDAASRSASSSFL